MNITKELAEIMAKEDIQDPAVNPTATLVEMTEDGHLINLETKLPSNLIN